jgi:hypothetical protein
MSASKNPSGVFAIVLPCRGISGKSKNKLRFTWIDNTSKINQQANTNYSPSLSHFIPTDIL